ncbi:hypothetical protein ACTFIW_002856 [Dictyostelium discoideum]
MHAPSSPVVSINIVAIGAEYTLLISAGYSRIVIGDHNFLFISTHACADEKRYFYLGVGVGVGVGGGVGVGVGGGKPDVGDIDGLSVCSIQRYHFKYWFEMVRLN